jgi:Protein of unknown function (DUF1207)
MSSTRVAAILLFLATVQVALVCAQQRLFPAVTSFELPEASPRVHGLVGRLMTATRGDSRFGREHEGEVVLGENFPVLALKEGRHPIILGLGSQVYGRFSLTDPKSALISTDWVVGVNTTAALNAWALTLEVYHESSHLGDEYGDRFPDDRLDWTREVLASWATYVTGPWRLTGGASYVLDDELKLPASAGALGLDYHGHSRRFLGGQARPVIGVFSEANAATHWRVSTSAKVGLAFAMAGESHEISLGLIGHDGLSTQRQFYRQQSRYLGVEVRFDL